MADTQYELRYLPLFYEDLEQKVIYILYIYQKLCIMKKRQMIY